MIIEGDCLSVMEQLPQKTFDLVITSPPFNLGTTSGGGFPTKKAGKWNGGSLAKGYGKHNDAMPKEEYREWQRTFLSKAWELLHDEGAIFYNHKPRIQNGIVELPMEWNPGLPLRQIIIWKRKGGFNFSPSFFLPTHEYILIYAKQDFRLKNKKVSGMGDVWEITQEKNNPQSASFPLELPKRILEATKKKTGVIIDPFAGSSTTGVAALLAGYRYIGIEIEPASAKRSIDRLMLCEKQLNKDMFF